MHLAPLPPPLNKFCIGIVFNFSLDNCNTQEKFKTKVMQKFGGQTRCIMGNMHLANEDTWFCLFGLSVSRTFDRILKLLN